MKKNEAAEFREIVNAIFEVFDKQLSATALKIWWQTLKKHDLHTIKLAMRFHVEHSKFSPKPADILEAIKQSDGRPNADEAWSIAIKASDEAETVIWNDDIAEAWGVALTLIQEGDKVAGRMAFKSAYDRIVEKHRDQGIPVNWMPSIGHDSEARKDVINSAVTKGLLTQAHPLPQLEDIDEEKRQENIQRIKDMVKGIGEIK